METRAHHVLIGLFTLLVVSAALIFALWLGKSDADRQFEVYDIVFQEAVSGLSKGGTVEFNGIKIGDVVSLRLDPEDAHRVIARVRVDSTAPVRSTAVSLGGRAATLTAISAMFSVPVTA